MFTLTKINFSLLLKKCTVNYRYTLIYCSIHNLMIKLLKNNPLAFLSDIKLFGFNRLKIIL